MKRRDFILSSAGVIGAALPVISRAQSKPCPPEALQVTGGTQVEATCVTPSSGDVPKWLEGRSVNEWFQIPNTRLSDCPPTTKSYVGGPRGKIEAWCGGALRRTGSIYLIGAAGGHADYSGNEVNALNLRSDAPRWVELRPSSDVGVAVNSAGVYLDFRASARHTYWATQFINQDDRLVVMPKNNPMNASGLVASTDANPAHIEAFPGGNVMPSFAAANWTAYDPGNDWDAETIRRTGNPRYARLPAAYSGTTGSVGCMNPKTGDLFLGASGRLFKWTRDGGAGSWRDLASMSDSYAATAIDFTRGRMLIAGNYGGDVGPRVRSIDDGELLSVTFGGLGASALTMGGYPGMIYDEANDRYLVFKNSSPITVYSVSPSSYEVTAMRVTGAVPAARPQGILNAVQYVPELKGLVMPHSYSSDIYFMRLA